MRILVVTQYFWPENFRINDLCINLATRGHDITVLTGKPNYPSGEIFPEFKKNPLMFNNINLLIIKDFIHIFKFILY